VVLSLISSLTVLPALISLMAPEGRALSRQTPPWLARLEHLPLRYARPIRIAAAVVGLGSLALIPRLHFDHNSLNMRDPNTESVQAFEDLISRSGTTPWTVDVVVPSLAAAEALAPRLAALPGVERTRTLADFVPADQEAKREILGEIALLVPPAREKGPAPGPQEQRAALARLADELAATVADGAGGDEALVASARKLEAAIRGFLAGAAATRPDAAFEQLQANVLGSLPEQMKDFERALDPGVVTGEDLPPEIRRQMLAADGRARIQVVPSVDLGDSATLTRFVDSIRAFAPEATGPAVTLLEWGRVTSRAMEQALVTGVIAMTLFLLWLWRNVWDTVLAVFPLALAAVVSCAAMVPLGLSFNFANVVVLPMLIGMGIDNGVHLVHRHRTNPEEEDVLATSTARAVSFAALTTVLCFGSLAFAPHRGMAAIGQFLTLGVAATFVSYVVVLPAVLEWDDRRAGRRTRREAVRPSPPTA
jgi:hopanoid biosynthesis associated RND transporter like protein HpnN